MDMDLEPDKLTQIYVNTKNIAALVQQLKVIQAEQQRDIVTIHALQQQVAVLKSELDQVKQIVFVLKATQQGNGPTVAQSQ